MIYIDEYGFALYVFILLLGVSIISYLIAFSRAIIVISSMSIFNLIQVNLQYNNIVRYLILFVPILIAILVSYPKRKYGVSILKYLAFIANMALTLSFFTVPFAGLSFIKGFEYLYLLILAIGFGNAYIVNYLVSIMPWFIVRYIIKSGEKTNTVIEKLKEKEQIEIMENSKLEVQMYGREDRLENTVIYVEPSNLWSIKQDSKKTSKKYILRPIEDGVSTLKIIYKGKPLHQIVLRSIGLSKIAKLMIEFIMGAKVVKIVETYHLVGTPLRQTLERIQRLMPKNFSIDNLSIQLREGNRYIPISVQYTGFEQGKEYNLIIQIKGESKPYIPPISQKPKTAPKLITREWTAKTKQKTIHNLKTLTHEYIAKETGSREKIEKPPGKTTLESPIGAKTKISEEELSMFLKEVYRILNELEQMGDDIW